MSNKKQDFNDLFKNITQPIKNKDDDDLDAKLNLKKHETAVHEFIHCVVSMLSLLKSYCKKLVYG